MKLIKLDAIDSTNDFLKALTNQQLIENFTVVTAEYQTNGKGQRGTVWNSEAGKNLIMSVLIKDFSNDNNLIFNINIVFSLAVVQALEVFKIPKLSIKWPNDIMSDNKKIGGILIENSIKSNGSIFSILGLGLNVNQTNFDSLPNATSISLIDNREFDRDEILKQIIKNLKFIFSTWHENAYSLREKYTKYLFKIGVPMPFEDKNGQQFMGIIKGISPSGKMEVLLDDDCIYAYDIKEIQMLY